MEDGKNNMYFIFSFKFQNLDLEWQFFLCSFLLPFHVKIFLWVIYVSRSYIIFLCFFYFVHDSDDVPFGICVSCNDGVIREKWDGGLL